MRRLLILSFLFCLLSLTESVNAAPNTISQTELDLKLELQKKDIDANRAENMNWWLAAIGIVVTLIGVFSAWRVAVTEKDAEGFRSC